MIQISTRARTREAKQTGGGPKGRLMDVWRNGLGGGCKYGGGGQNCQSRVTRAERGWSSPLSDRRNHGTREICPGRSLHNKQITALVCRRKLRSLREKGRSRRKDARPDSRSLGRRTGLDVLVVVEHVLGVVLGFHFGEPPVGVIAVGLADAARVVVGVEEVHVDAGTVGLQGVEE